jgi:peptidoglycan/xylan/chitin deacetylase (PgdA/CDA1 family)
MSKQPLTVTTSWDDGHALDLRTAELLCKFGLKGTFYVTFNHPGRPEITPGQIRELAALGMEIGSHTLSHRLLIQVPPGEVFRELNESKRRLEDIVGQPVRAISYPLGYTNAAVLQAWKQAGYTLGRTTEAFRWSYRFDPARMPVTAEFNRGTRLGIARHAARDGNLRGLWRWFRHAGLTSDPVVLSRGLAEHVAARGGVFHLLSRSPDVESLGLWEELRSLLHRLAAFPDARRLTNSEVLEMVQTRGDSSPSGGPAPPGGTSGPAPASSD